MKLELYRVRLSDTTTQGEMLVDGKWECFTLEDRRRNEWEPKIDGKTAIPEGEYVVVLDHSYRFNRIMPHILDVPEFEGIRIHPGNTESDTSGCILVGLSRAPDYVGNSRMAFNRVMAKLEDAVAKNEDITIEIKLNPISIGDLV